MTYVVGPDPGVNQRRNRTVQTGSLVEVTRPFAPSPLRHIDSTAPQRSCTRVGRAGAAMPRPSREHPRSLRLAPRADARLRVHRWRRAPRVAGTIGSWAHGTTSLAAWRSTRRLATADVWPLVMPS
jgi:hypothetical protein